MITHRPGAAVSSALDAASLAALESTTTQPVKGVATASQVTSALATSALLIAANADRKSVVIANKHATATLYINRATPAVITNFPIPAGQSFTDDLTVGAWYGITDGAATDARIIEVA